MKCQSMFFRSLVHILIMTTGAIFFGCKHGGKPDSTKFQVDTITSVPIIENGKPLNNTPSIPKLKTDRNNSIKYVNAESGLNFRRSPNGIILGKINYGTTVRIVSRTGMKMKMNDENGNLEGEWVGVLYNQVLVYVFDAFLGDERVPRELIGDMPNYEVVTGHEEHFELFELVNYEKEEDKRTGFINISQAYPWNKYENSSAVESDYIDLEEVPEYHILSEEYRKRFLMRSGISRTDTVYIYNPQSAKVLRYPVEKLPIMAVMNPYGHDGLVSQYDYMIGFDLDGILINYDWRKYYAYNFVFIGEENPFVPGGLQPVKWAKIEKQRLISNLSNTEVGLELSKVKTDRLYYDNRNGFDFYAIGDGRIIVVSTQDKKIVFNAHFGSGEGSTLKGLNYVDNNEEFIAQWTGQFIKDYPQVVFGFQYLSFGCNRIYFLGGENILTTVLCDNRH